jgi:hypothetical protein
MFSQQIINNVVDWERRLEIEQENRTNYRIERFSDPDPRFSMDASAGRKKRESIFARYFRPARETRPDLCCSQEQCPKAHAA